MMRQSQMILGNAASQIVGRKNKKENNKSQYGVEFEMTENVFNTHVHARTHTISFRFEEVLHLFEATK